MTSMREFVSIAGVLCLSLGGMALADTASTEPNAAELVRAVRESENWIHKVDRFELHVKSVWTSPPPPATAKKENESTSRRRGSPYESGTRDALWFAFDSERVGYRHSQNEQLRCSRLWDGEKAIAHERSASSEKGHYFLLPETERLFVMFAYISWPRSQPHSFWFHFRQRDVKEAMKYYGYPDKFVLTGRQSFRGVDCYVLDWKPAEGLFHAKDISYRWYVGAKDGLLHGKATLYDNQVETEHYMLEYREVAPGCWYPMKQGYEIYEEYSEGKYYLYTRRDIETVKVRINEALPEELLTIEFKEGVEVTDRRFGQNTTYMYKDPLVGKAFPSLEGIDVDFDRGQTQDESVLFCFFDCEQRPSRNCITQLKKELQELQAKGVVVVAIQASKTEKAKLSEWVESSNIPFAVGIIGDNEEQTRFNWGVKSLPWLVLTDRRHIVAAEGFGISELDERIAAVSKE